MGEGGRQGFLEVFLVDLRAQPAFSTKRVRGGRTRRRLAFARESRCFSV